MIIYKIINNINGKSYMGQTTASLSKRWYGHTKSKNCKALSAAIAKYGKENFSFETICTCMSKEELDEKEKYYIELFNTIAPNGYNLRPGGNTSSHSEESRKKISEKRKGRSVPHTEESKKKISEANSKRKWKQGSRDKLSASRTGRSNGPHVDATKYKMSTAQNKNKVPVLCIENNQTYESVKLASIALNLNKSHIFSILAGTRKHTKGYTFKRI